MTSRSIRSLALAAVLFATTAFAAVPAPAFAAPGVTLESVDLQFDPGTVGHEPLLIVTGTVPDTTPLPATIRLPIAQGTTIRWAGEVLGGALEDDPTLQPSIEHTEDGYDIVSLTLSAGRRGQIELDAPGLVAQDGTSRLVRLAWMPVDEVGSINLMTAVPLGATISTMTPGATTGPGPANGTLISLETSGSVGGEVLLQVAYEVPGAAAATATGAQGSSGASVLIFGAVALLFVAFGAAIFKRTRGRADSASDELEIATDRDTQADTDEGTSPEAAEEAAEDDAATAAPPGSRRFSPQVIILALVAVVLGGAVFMMSSGEAPGTSRTTEEYSYRVLADVDADSTAKFGIRLSEADPAHESIHVFDAVAGVRGIRSVKVIFAAPGVEIEYDSSMVDEAAIASALSAGGYPPN